MRLTPICRWCGQGPLRPRYSFAASGLAAELGCGPFHLHACQACGAWQVNPHPGPEAAKKFFASPERWQTSLDPDNRPVSPLERAESRRQEYWQYAKALQKWLPESGAVMDVGAGVGLLLSLLGDCGRTKVAVEPNGFAADKAADRGLVVLRSWAEDLAAPKSPLAALIMNQTLDHLPRPDIFLTQARNWLAPGGLLLLGGLINPSCLMARIHGPSFRLFHPFHQVYPTPKAVDKVLAPYGFELVALWRPYFRTPYGSASKFAEALGQTFLKLVHLAPDQPSRAFPGNTVTYLYRKKILYRTIKVKEPAHSSI
ncbi:MAG: methyltransferase domain-containing protein [Deltaproteobacteria bacterium]|jgi:SAM-dependent methyltransferase|nr:methyltransferase domain-containing protein [Deltaproteobacteria bacterium]